MFSQVDVQYTTYSLQLNIDIVSFRRSYYILSSATFTSTKFFMSFTLVVFLLLKGIHPNCYYMNDYLLDEMKYQNKYPVKWYNRLMSRGLIMYSHILRKMNLPIYGPLHLHFCDEGSQIPPNKHKFGSHLLVFVDFSWSTEEPVVWAMPSEIPESSVFKEVCLLRYFVICWT